MKRWLCMMLMALLAGSAVAADKVALLSTRFVLERKFKMMEEVARAQGVELAWTQVDAEGEAGVRRVLDGARLVIFDARDYSISNAIELPAESVRGLSRRSEWVAGNRVRVFADLLNAPGAVDVTALLQDSLAAL